MFFVACKQVRQWGFNFLMLMAVVFALCGLLPGLVPLLNRNAGILYVHLVVVAIALIAGLLLLGELWLTVQQLKSKASRSSPLRPQQLRELLRAGTRALGAEEPPPVILTPHTPSKVAPALTPSRHYFGLASESPRPNGSSKPSSRARLTNRSVPVWQRGLEHSVLQAFLPLFREEACVQMEDESRPGTPVSSPKGKQSLGGLGTLNVEHVDSITGPKTFEVCQQLVKPLTASARCSAWEALAAGLE